MTYSPAISVHYLTNLDKMLIVPYLSIFLIHSLGNRLTFRGPVLY